MVSRQSQAMAKQAHAVQLAKPSLAAPVHRRSCNPKMGNQTVQRLLHDGVIQAKLTVNQPGDRFEQEADRVAAQVMRMPDPTVGTPPHVQRMCAECGEEVQRKQASGAEEVGADFHHPQGGGQTLPEAERSFFEPRFGYDFSQVRIHTDWEAGKAARSVGALAYTLGSEVVFGAGQYRPGTQDGRQLLAHELAHTIQQTRVGTQEIRRKIGDGHDLTASRFAGDVVLEAVYDNERVLKSGDKGAAVRKLQQALLDAGFSPPRFGVTGDFGSETTAAVEDFQRASGLAGGLGKGVNGILDATTMGWLDQRFSAGPTPPGTTLGATPGCPSIKTVNVDIVFLHGSNPRGLQDLDRASSIFNQCCVRFALAGGGSEGATRTQALFGGAKVLHISPKCGDRTAEEITMFEGATADFNLSGRIRAFYVDSITPASTPFGHTDAYSVPPSCATGSGAAVRNMVVITNTASGRGLAHELGHILLNAGNSAHQDMDPEYLMSPAGSLPGERLTPTQCGTIFANA